MIKNTFNVSEMVSKRKQNRKVKREIRRKVIQKKAANQQQSAVPKDQDMMLRD